MELLPNNYLISDNSEAILPSDDYIQGFDALWKIANSSPEELTIEDNNIAELEHTIEEQNSTINTLQNQINTLQSDYTSVLNLNKSLMQQLNSVLIMSEATNNKLKQIESILDL